MVIDSGITDTGILDPVPSLRRVKMCIREQRICRERLNTTQIEIKTRRDQ